MTEARHILVVDDDVEVLHMVSEYLTSEAGYRVDTAMNGEEMREILAANPVDLVILDLGLAGEDGLDLARELRAESDIGIIIMSGRVDLVDRVVGLEIGADDYLTKPCHPRELLARVRSNLRLRDAARGKHGVKSPIKQDGNSSQERPNDTSPAEVSPVWRIFRRIGVIVGILAGLAAIVGVVLTITS